MRRKFPNAASDPREALQERIDRMQGTWRRIEPLMMGRY